MTESSRENYFTFELYRSLKFHNIGQSICQPVHRYGPQKRDHYILHFITSGKGIFETNGIRYHLQSGQFFFIQPDKWAFYEADAASPWTYYWLIFSGEDVEDIIKALGLSERIPIGTVEFPSQIKELFDTLFKLMDENNQNSLFIQAKLIELLSLFTQNYIESFQQYQYSEKLYSNKYLKQFFDYTNENYGNSALTIEDIANHLSVHRTYLNRILKKELAKTPIEFLLNYRINKSVLLLESSNLTITQIANLVGYENPYSFSRAFSTIKGMPPSKFRKNFYSSKKAT